MDDRSQVDLLSRDERKPLFQIETELSTEKTQGSGSGPVGFTRAFIQDFLHQIEIRFHPESGCHRIGEIAKSKGLR